MTEDLLKEMINITENYVDSPRVFHESLAYYILSSTLEKFTILVALKLLKLKNLYLKRRVINDTYRFFENQFLFIGRFLNGGES